MENILKLTQINKSFPVVKALSDVNLTVRKGEVHALVGENGAGKSTLMKIISGAYKKDSGTVWFDGQEVENTTPKQSEMMGISIIYQELNQIERITVADNVFIGRYPMKHGMVQWKEMFQQAQALFDEYELKINAKSLVRSLTMAQKQMVEIIKAVSINAKIIIMDEPTSSLSGKETESLFKIIRKLKSRGVAIVFITHRLDEIFEICDRMTVLRDGCYIGERNICDITKDEMIAMMIGRKLTQQYPERSNPIGEVTLEVKKIIDHNSRVKGISFQAHRGEVLGFYGLVGAGRTETMRMIWLSVVSSPTRVALQRRKPEQLTVAAETPSPGALSTGTLSPVNAASLTALAPSSTMPSTGMLWPGRTTNTSPLRTCAAGILTSLPSRITVAVSGARALRLMSASVD